MDLEFFSEIFKVLIKETQLKNCLNVNIIINSIKDTNEEENEKYTNTLINIRNDYYNFVKNFYINICEKNEDNVFNTSQDEIIKRAEDFLKFKYKKFFKKFTLNIIRKD